MKVELLAVLAEMTLAMSVTLLLVWAARALMRRSLGAVVTYRLWMLVPVAMLASLLPAWAPLSDAAFSPTALATVEVVSQATQAQIAQTGAQAWLLGAWASGAVLMALWLVAQQCRFVRSLGSLQAQGDGVFRASASSSVPVLIGALTPRIVVPAEFETRYTPEQQELILLHERIHLRHGDAQINAVTALLRCLFWFNPLLHFAAALLRIDQELACDALVLRQRPKARRSYAEAMLNTQLADTGLPVGCQWQSSHPLKERIQMMNHPTPSPLRRRLGTLLLATLMGTTAALSWASQTPVSSQAGAADREPAFARVSPPTYPAQAARDGIGGSVLLEIGIDVDGRPSTINIVHSQPPGVFDAAASEAAAKWTFEPALKGGVAIAALVTVPVTFSPDDAPVAPVSEPGKTVLDALQVRSPKQ
jgi:bla regulator protein blaR1